MIKVGIGRWTCESWRDLGREGENQTGLATV